MQRKQIKSMVSLLGDRSVRVRNRVSTFLESALPGIAPVLQEYAEEEEDPLIRERLVMILEFGKSNDPRHHWEAMKRNMAFNLSDGMATISLLDQDEKVTRLEILQQIDELSDNWFRPLPDKLSADEKVANLLEYLFKTVQFRGNSEDYYSLENCFFHRMFAKKKGLPVTLSILAVILAEEAGLNLYGIGLPLHFIVGHFQGSKGIRFFDCFDNGREVTQDECVQYLRKHGIYFHPQLLSPCDNEAILNRVLVNIKHIAQRNEKVEQLAMMEAFTGSAELRTY